VPQRRVVLSLRVELHRRIRQVRALLRGDRGAAREEQEDRQGEAKAAKIHQK
jgi:hypothetical protein